MAPPGAVKVLRTAIIAVDSRRLRCCRERSQGSYRCKRRKLDLDIRFEFGSDELTAESRKDLDELGRALEHPAMKKRRFELAGHTDDVGSEPYNMSLSKRRANSARNYLLERFAVDPETVRSAGYGEQRPLIEGSSDEARRRNRRVVIGLLP